MGSSSALRLELQAARVGRGLEGFTARQREAVALQPSGVEELDAMLGGGFPRGSLVEVCGTASSGRTSLSLALLAQATSRQEACAFVDVSDALDPMSLAAAGVDATRLLWVRCRGAERRAEPSQAASVPLENAAVDSAGGVATKARASAPSLEKPKTGFAWKHPRDQIRGVETAIPSLVRQTSSGGVRSHTAVRENLIAQCTGEQVEIDRQPPRRGDNARRRPLPQERMRSWEAGQERLDSKKRGFAKKEESSGIVQARSNTQWNPPLKHEFTTANLGGARVNAKPWKRLEQALKTTDLLLHSGGWGVVVFDLGSISWTEARRIPMNTWFRFRRVVENSPTILLLLGEEPCAKSCASLVLRCRRLGEKWSSTASHEMNSVSKLGVTTLQGFEVQGEIACSRMQRLKVDSARWQTRTLWNSSF